MPRAILYKLHPQHPEPYKIAKIAQALEAGALMLYPSDTVYAVGCDPRNKTAIERVRAIKPQTSFKLLTLLCPSLADIATYAYVDDAAFKLMRSLTPGPFTFILKGTKEMPRLVLDPRRKTAGLRIPDHPICRAILARLGGILASTSAKLPDTEEVESLDELFDLFSHRVDLIVDDGGALRNVPSTVIDLATPDFEIVREGLGMEALTPFLK